METLLFVREGIGEIYANLRLDRVIDLHFVLFFRIYEVCIVL
jgi:hypothetical protein